MLSASPFRCHPLLAAIAAATPGALCAQTPSSIEPFELGAIVVRAPRPAATAVGDDLVAHTIKVDEMRRHNRQNIGDALNLLPGVSLSNNSRNEKTISVRGFDARQVPLFIDGIPVYVPYDGYVDFARFTTADLAAIQVTKGFSSVAFGPNALGGAINLVSRRPSRAFEGDAAIGLGAAAERSASVNLGSNQGLWYVQLGASLAQSDGFLLSHDFQPTATENGGLRNNATQKDRKLSLKLGLTPGAGDEYALSYQRQDGEKGQPPSTDPAAARYWRWPQWDKESVYFTSKTRLGEHESVKLRLYHDRFGNEVDSYTNSSYTQLKPSGKGSVSTGRSIYRDRTTGGAIEVETRRLSAHTLRLVGQHKRDEHQERDANALQNTHFKDRLSTLAIEDNIELAERWQAVLGLARHTLTPDRVFSLGNPYSRPDKQSANQVQAGLFHDWSSTARLSLTTARTSRLPTLKDRYSQRLGTYIENPELRAEQAYNHELRYQGSPWPGSQAEVAVFRSDIRDKIQSVANVSGNKSQMQNVGKVRAWGTELSLRGRVNTWLELGGAHTFVQRKNLSDPGTRLTDVPRHKLTVNARLIPNEQLEVLLDTEHNSHRWASNTVSLSSFTTHNLQLIWHVNRASSVQAGVNNLTDRNFSLADGFPSAGRMWFVNARHQF